MEIQAKYTRDHRIETGLDHISLVLGASGVPLLVVSVADKPEAFTDEVIQETKKALFYKIRETATSMLAVDMDSIPFEDSE